MKEHDYVPVKLFMDTEMCISHHFQCCEIFFFFFFSLFPSYFKVWKSFLDCESYKYRHWVDLAHCHSLPKLLSDDSNFTDSLTVAS